jgi:hypothetical protein
MIGISVAFMRRPDRFLAPLPVRLVLIVALLLFVGAACVGLLVNSPRKYVQIQTDELWKMVDADVWQETEDRASWRIARTRVNLIAAARAANVRKAQLLQAAIIAEVTAVILVAASGSILLVVP